MAARALKDLDDAVPPLTRALTLMIRAAHQSAGSPSFTLLDSRNARAGRGTLAKATLSRILTPDPAAKDQSLPAWSYYEGLLAAVDVDPAPIHPQWQAAQEEWQARARGESPESSGPEEHSGSQESPELPAVLQPVSMGPALVGSVVELEPRMEPGYAAQPSPRTVATRRRRSLLVLASIVGSAAVVVAVSAFALIGGSQSQSPSPSQSRPQPQAAPASAPKAAHQPTAVLVTASPPITVLGKIVRTWNQDANNGRGGSIGVLVFPTPFALNGSNGPRHDGDVVEVVCHTAHGRMIHERLDAKHENSTGWFQIYYEDRLWWVPDHYISVPAGVPSCS
ncbi:hypothetical protein ABIA35_000061 [Catenulispora sp. MAP12-49]